MQAIIIRFLLEATLQAECVTKYCDCGGCDSFS